ncbi:hypothetical protein E2C01_030109 [Portunus trituberculatus]|uniref:Uncharacterized protein n=1 Tax=Portunus trituberculatus TaxID=210409 RepID=A0A5B7ER79_PORTR|nr:hypothetical protein [Portunus trituberculatus]
MRIKNRKTERKRWKEEEEEEEEEDITRALGRSEGQRGSLYWPDTIVCGKTAQHGSKTARLVYYSGNARIVGIAVVLNGLIAGRAAADTWLL